MNLAAKRLRLKDRRVYRLTGSDGIDLLQRISTADMSPLTQGRPVATLLTNEKGRVVDIAGIIPVERGSMLMTGVGDVDGRLARWIDRFIIMEDLTVTDVSSEWSVAAGYDVDEEGHWRLPETDDRSVVSIAAGPHRWGLFVAASGTSEVPSELIDEEAFHHGRILAGVPWVGHEIGEQRHPLEARLRSMISFTKGCYIGQEVIARLDAYRKVAMALTRFRGSFDSRDVVPFGLLDDAGGEAGIITSLSRQGGSSVALGFARMSALSGPSPLRTLNGTTVTPVDTDPSSGIYS